MGDTQGWEGTGLESGGTVEKEGESGPWLPDPYLGRSVISGHADWRLGTTNNLENEPGGPEDRGR